MSRPEDARGAESNERAAIVLRRVRRRLIPFAFICYVVAYIDRVNVGFAARELQRDLGLSSAQYGIGAGLFFLGYCLTSFMIARVLLGIAEAGFCPGMVLFLTYCWE